MTYYFSNDRPYVNFVISAFICFEILCFIGYVISPSDYLNGQQILNLYGPEGF